MIVDTSAIVAIVVKEPGYERLLETLTEPDTRAGIGTPTLAELGLVLSSRLGTDARAVVAGLVDHLHLSEVPFGEPHWRAAIEAFWRYGRGRHPAALNFGDCLTYAVASLAGEPLLFVGDDFSHTDLDAA
ncbi:MAG TPA: type II toxin-antitoxin system VapC family toxin [Acidimicrobiales bacterium]|nr:type II toxin-antitoxin system VapC family toxin [Acidimicrobiales bacterium]